MNAGAEMNGAPEGKQAEKRTGPYRKMDGGAERESKENETGWLESES